MATTLEAVNELLEAIGEPPATVLDTGGTSIEAEAETILNREKRRVLGQGPATLGAWHSTLLKETKFSLDGVAPGATPTFKDYIAVRWASRPYLRVTVRDGVLYDMENDASLTTGTVTLDVATNPSFSDLTPRMQDLVIAEAAVAFQRAKKRGREDDAVLRDKLQKARAMAMQEDDDLSQSNMLGGSGEQQVLGNRYSYGRGFYT